MIYGAIFLKYTNKDRTKHKDMQSLKILINFNINYFLYIDRYMIKIGSLYIY